MVTSGRDSDAVIIADYRPRRNVSVQVLVDHDAAGHSVRYRIHTSEDDERLRRPHVP